jgi:8-oxo-dGTP pyrophosphatase MutT (NUDIX family)
MIIFIKDRPIRILSQKNRESLAENSTFDTVIDVRLDLLKATELIGHVLVLNATAISTEKLFNLLNKLDLSELQSVTVVAKYQTSIEDRIQKMFTVVKAAGGVVVKDDKILLMYRRGVWDLPKGKLDSGEKSKRAAVREVEEETGVEAELLDKICVTWHTYLENDKQILKRTKWYLMRCVNDNRLSPQKEEGIDKLEWATEVQAKKLLVNSFSSIRYVFEAYKKVKETL